MNILHRITPYCLLLCLFFPATNSAANSLPDHELNPERAKLLGYIVSEHLTRHHYSHKRLNDELSIAAFDLYIKQLDAQKRFLLQTDIKMLGAYETYIDNEIRRGMIHLPIYSSEIMSQRIPIVKEMIIDLLAKPFDLTISEELETDTKKLTFCQTDQQLRERWRKTLKYQVANRYLDLKEEQEEKTSTSASEEPVENQEKVVVVTDDQLREQAREKVATRYTQLLDRMLQDQRKDHFDRYLNAISRAYDPHSNYLPPDQKEDFDIHMRGSLEGIGALLREEDGYIKVVNVIPGGAAEQEGQLESEDTILKVAEGDQDPVDITDTRIRDAVTLIRGPKGTEVILHVRKADGSRKTIRIIREVVQIKETFVKSTVVEHPDDGTRYGYLKIPSFYRDFTNGTNDARNVTTDTLAELNNLKQQNISGLILDLRNNGGGSLSDSVDTTGLFIEKGPVVQIKDSTGKIVVLSDNDPTVHYDGPLIVLVNKFSASASEILAGALQDYNRAIIVGSEHTHGKGTVQAVIDLDQNMPLRNMEKFKPLGALKITVQKFYRISGDSTQYRGIEADIVLPDRFKAIKSGEQYLDYSMPWDTILSSDYEPLPNTLPIARLKKTSEQRVSKNSAMQKISEQSRKTQDRIENTQRNLLLTSIRSERNSLDGDNNTDETGLPPHETTNDDEEWQTTIHSDPYVLEAIALIRDISLD